MPTIHHEFLHSWATTALTATGVHPPDAELIARCLVDVDLLGVKSHGTRLLRRYVNEYREGLINPRPKIRQVKDAGGIVQYDGDGGAGYLVATVAVDTACEAALEHGIAMASTFNHGHVGSAGIYARRAIDCGLISWCMEGGVDWAPPREPNATIWDAIREPPMCFGVPADPEGPPLVVDMNANLFGGSADVARAISEGFPKAVFGSLGMRFVSTLVGGLSGRQSNVPDRKHKGANRGFQFVAIDPNAIADGAVFRAHVRHVIDESLKLEPIGGTDRAELPGSLEWKRTRKWSENGVPIPDDHAELLEQIASEADIDPPQWL